MSRGDYILDPKQSIGHAVEVIEELIGWIQDHNKLTGPTRQPEQPSVVRDANMVLEELRTAEQAMSEPQTEITVVADGKPIASWRTTESGPHITYATGAGSPPRSRDDKLKIALQDLELPPERYQHFEYLFRSQGIYSQRYMKYQDLPILAMGAKGALHEARVCLERAWIQVWLREFLPDPDDLLDGINYFVHTIRQALAGNYNGERNWFPPSVAAES